MLELAVLELQLSLRQQHGVCCFRRFLERQPQPLVAAVVVSLQGFSDDAGVAQLQWKIPRRQAAGSYTANVVDIVKSGYDFNPASGVTSVAFTIQ